MCLALFSTVATAGLVLQGSNYFAAFVPVGIAFLYALQKFYLRTSRQLRLLDLQASAPLYAHLLETVDGLSTIRAFGWQSATTEQAFRLLDQAQKPHYLLFCIQRWLTLVLDLFVAACGVILITFSVVLPWSTSAGSIALALVNLIGLSQLLTHVISSWTTLETSLGAVARLKSFEKSSPQESCLTEAARDPPDFWPVSGSIQIKDITASHSTISGAVPVLRNISLDICPGEKVAICGRTGSGKSSLLLTLFRLVELDSGSITIDGQEIHELRHGTLRQRLISVPQEATAFPGSLRSNLTAATLDNSSLQPTDEQLISVLSAVELWDKISLRGGFDTDITDLAMSHGQIQLLCLARAILRQKTSPILILDEAMSAVDEQTERVMCSVIETEFTNHTILSVAHKLDTVLSFDKIVLLDGGRIVETGNPNDLLGKENGKFRALFEGKNRV